MSITIEFCIFKLVEVPNFCLKSQFCIAGPSLPKNGISGLKQKKCASLLKSAYSYQPQYEIQLQITISIFRTKFTQKRNFQSKTEKVNIPLELCIFKLVKTQNLSLK